MKKPRNISKNITFRLSIILKGAANIISNLAEMVIQELFISGRSPGTAAGQGMSFMLKPVRLLRTNFYPASSTYSVYR